MKALSALPSYAELLRIIRETGITRGEQIYREISRRDPTAGIISEKCINDLGYELLSGGKVDEAVRMLRLNVERYPRLILTTAWQMLIRKKAINLVPRLPIANCLKFCQWTIRSMSLEEHFYDEER